MFPLHLLPKERTTFFQCPRDGLEPREGLEVSGERNIPVPSLPQIELRTFNPQPVTLVAEQLQGQSAHWIPEAQLCRTKYILRSYTVICAAWVWANMAVPVRSTGTGGGGVCTGGN
jgi:hypothetical protein